MIETEDNSELEPPLLCDDDPLLGEVYRHPELSPREFIKALCLRAVFEVRREYFVRKIDGDFESLLANFPTPPTVTEEQGRRFALRRLGLVIPRDDQPLGRWTPAQMLTPEQWFSDCKLAFRLDAGMYK